MLRLPRTIRILWLAGVWSGSIWAAESPATPGPHNAPIDLSRYAQVRYVSATAGSDNGGDGSAAKPWATIGHALAQASSADRLRRSAILIAKGVYREQSLAMKPFVDLLGGFESDHWTRDTERNVTILDGNRQHRIATGADNARLDGFTLLHGRVRGNGGAILCEGTSPEISNNRFFENGTAGPANWKPTKLHDVANDGGAIAVSNRADPIIEHNIFARNTTEVGRGGAIACNREASPKISGNVIVQNLTGLNDIMRSSDGGAISVYDHSNPEILDNVIAANRTLHENDAGGIFVALWSAPRISGNRIVGNTSSDDAGGLFIGGQEHHYGTPLDPVPPADRYLVRISGNVIMGNENPSHNSGAARITMQSRAEFKNNVVAFNQGLYFQSSAVDARNNTVIEPLLVVNDSKASRELPGPTNLISNIFWGASDIRMETNTARNDFRGGHAGEGDIAEEPKFLDDAWKGSVTLQRRRDQAESTMVPEQMPAATALSGRPIKIGTFWTVIRDAQAGRITIWGVPPEEFGDGPLLVEIPPTYKLQAGSPCLGSGENGSNMGASNESGKSSDRY